MQSLKSTRPIHYVNLSKLGEGAFSTVYKALRRDSEFDIQQWVALKILKSEIAIENWRDEFQALERVQSEKCVRVTGWDVLENCPTLVLEWVDGVTLGRLSEIPLSSQQIDEICLQILEGLRDIHGAGLLHGDLSLQNVMINRSGEIKLLDFGLSKTRSRMFTPEFAAPEVIDGESLSPGADLFSLGRIRECLERKAKLPISFTTKELLRSSPDRRRFNLTFEPLDYERELSRLSIGRLVEEHKTFDESKACVSTCMIQSPRSGLLKNALVLILTTAALGSASATYDNREAYIAVRTAKWFEIALDGKSLGYPPIELSLKSNVPHTFEWKSADSQGHRSLTLKPGQNMVITDEFFN